MGQLPRERRITKRREIVRLLRGPRAKGRALELYWSPAAGDRPRAACTTPKFGRSSVERNRLRRRLKELVREILLERSPACDYLVRARPEAYELDFERLRDELRELTRSVRGPAAPDSEAS